MTESKPKALFFAPHSFIWRHAYPEALIAEALESQNFEIHYLTCGKALKSWCVAMDSTGAREDLPDSEKERICAKCERNRDLLVNHFGFDGSSLQQHLTTENLSEIESLLKNIKRSELLDFQIEGIEIGRASLYNFTINRKKYFEREFTDSEWDDFLLHFRSSLISFYAGRNLLERVRPDCVFFYSSSYSANLVVRLQAEKLGIACYSLYAGLNWENRFQRMHVSDLDSFNGFDTMLARWEDTYKHLPATETGLNSSLIHQKMLLAGNHSMIYGGGNARMSPRDIRRKWGIPEDSKVLFLAASSYDEQLAAKVIRALPEKPKEAFTSQADWMKATIEYVSGRKDLTLVIRVHPREFPNRRESFGSEHSLRLKELFRDLPDNVKINWPDDGMSLYDWLEIIDLGLTAWSSAGKEFALWGIPNISYAVEISFYPIGDLGFVAATPDEYLQRIDEALEAGWSHERILLAYRWSAYELEGSVFDISDVIRSDFVSPPSLTTRVLNKLTARRFQESKLFCYHMAPVEQAPLIARRVLSGEATVDILEPEIERLSEKEEARRIRRLVSEIADVRFGEDWRENRHISALRSNLYGFLSSTIS